MSHSSHTSPAPDRQRSLALEPARALDFVNTVERMRWVPRVIVRQLMSRYVDKHCLPSHRAVLHDVGPGDVVIDLGANVGLFSTYFAARGATVHAFEPDPSAYGILIQHAKRFEHLHVHQAAVFNKAGDMTLYRHTEFAKDSNYAQSSTLIADKRNVSGESAVVVPVRDIAEVLQGIAGRIKLIKMDIEGAEAAVLRRMLEIGALDRVDHVLVETHEDIVPGLDEELRHIKRQLSELHFNQVDFSWY